MKSILLIIIFILSSVLLTIPNSLTANSILNNKSYKESSSSEIITKNSDLQSEQISGFLDENGNPLFKNNSRAGDTLETDAIQERILNGLVAGDEFGYSISGAGDINGDGYEDVIVGAPFNDAGGANAGRVFIYFGGINFNSSPDVVITGATGNQLGFSVSSAGDMNSDGYDDVIAGLPAYSTNTGRAYVYLGGANMNSVIDLTLTGEATGNFFGTSVSGAGDVNGDGFSDVVVGAPNNASNVGEAYIYFGGSVLNNTVDVTLNENLANNFFGNSVSNAGDFNGDGFSDVVVGAYGYSTNLGRAYIYYGGSSMNNTADNISFGFIFGEFYGYSVSDAGDFNGDGYGDVVVGSYKYSANLGSASILFGGAAADATADVLLMGENSAGEFGRSVSSAGDVNGDGYDDVVIGSPNFNSGEGKAYLFRGGESQEVTAAKILSAENAGDRMGHAVSGCGDINGDGNDDFIAAANLNDQNGTSSGRVYVYFNTMSGNDVSDVSFFGNTIHEYLGYSVSDAGDVNGDGFDDVIVGGYNYNSGQGRVNIYFGGTITNNTADVTITGVSAGDNFGISVSKAGDVNGDGFDDVVVGASGYNAGTLQGRAYVYYGGSSMNTVADVTMTGGAVVGDEFGGSVSTAGDFNGDGFDDVIVGEEEFSTSQGKAYLYYGSSSMNSIADVIFSGLSSGGNFGHSVSDAGDVNGDGYGDVIIGAHRNDSDTGQVYIFFGGSSPNNFDDIRLTGVSQDDFFGVSVSGAGDVNGDGYSDVLVGAYGYPSGDFKGRTYLYFGGLNMNTAADLTITGTNESEYLGLSVSDAGDVNGDNFDDFIIGARGFSNNTGYAAIYFGGSTVNSVADLWISKYTPTGFFGVSVSGAGDINDDGYDDVVVGEYAMDNGTSNTGAAHVYFSSPLNVNPRISTIKDVTFDQGGKVKIKWNRSGYDYINQSLITDYLIEISDPPGVNGFHWEAIGSIPASLNTQYQYTANTPNDSLEENSGVYFYRVTALTSDPDQFWRSNIMSGYSIDNLAPLMVSPFNAVSELSNVRLNWGENQEEDIQNYILYRSVNPAIDPYSETPFAIVTDLTFLDTSPLSGLYYYFIVAQDIHGNYSPVAVAASPNITLNLSMFIEGFYNAASNSQVSDTINVQLRNTVSPYAVVDNSSAIVSSSGNAILKFCNAPDGNYYIVIKHRNSIETWSSGGVSVSRMSSSDYDFTNAPNKAYGNNMKQADVMPVRFAIYSGDVNQDGNIDAPDLTLADNDAFNFVTGYVKTDVTGNNVVDASDLTVIDNNAFNFVGKVTPP